VSSAFGVSDKAELSQRFHGALPTHTVGSASDDRGEGRRVASAPASAHRVDAGLASCGSSPVSQLDQPGSKKNARLERKQFASVRRLSSQPAYPAIVTQHSSDPRTASSRRRGYILDSRRQHHSTTSVAPPRCSICSDSARRQHKACSHLSTNFPSIRTCTCSRT
jgi:hypothetical protein